MTAFDPIKDPDANLDYQWSWAAWLAEGETITDVTWIVPGGIDSHDEAHTDATATIWLIGGDAGQSYDITCRITTNQGRTDDRTRTIYVRER